MEAERKWYEDREIEGIGDETRNVITIDMADDLPSIPGDAQNIVQNRNALYSETIETGGIIQAMIGKVNQRMAIGDLTKFFEDKE